MANRKVIIYLATSLDGFIAGENDDISWLSTVDRPGEDYGFTDFYKTVDTVVMGRRTYDKARTFKGPFPHRSKKCYVVSRQKSGSDENVTFFNGNPGELIQQLKEQKGKNIFCDGGAEIIHELLQQNLVDRYIVSVIPILVGSGIALFKSGRPQQHLQLTRSTTFPSGLVQLWYEPVQ
jgi:dihydrofolate reductase